MQIDCVTVKGSNQPMGLFTYDVTLENVAGPSADGDAGAPDLETFSTSAYEHEFEEHPDLVKCVMFSQQTLPLSHTN